MAENLSEGRLALGGAIKKGNFKTAALAVVDLTTNSLEFSKLFKGANGITAVAQSPTDTLNVVALATQTFAHTKPKTFILEFSPSGDLIREPIAMSMQAFSGRGNVALSRASLLFDRDSNFVVAFGHENHKLMSQVSVHSADERH